ncbi:MAG: hypothetical protein HOK21_13665 [Rhodospirillaceae bacterium]|nr:hypothetical protein [Rhodospirillaceae bacterium]MBT4688913.1 hypothetical protein [Rhodospirillaceae bacterium]MBT5525132.1 hypothetical protein [Rhodospirillaceae bacterium]MBT5878377.1 hypothetical protein [Rhodospirillaceae bacterium]MBT6589545.1 hypothetical protein [Rhodospirillaceae bacterium]
MQENSCLTRQSFRRQSRRGCCRVTVEEAAGGPMGRSGGGRAGTRATKFRRKRG